MMPPILSLIVSWFLLVGYILAAGAVLWIAGIAVIACTDRGSPFKRVCKSGVWR